MGKLFDFKYVIEYFPQIISRLHITLLIVLLAAIIGMALGILIAFCRLYKIPVLNQIATVYISFVRGTPIIVQLFIVYYGLPMLLLMIGIDINRWNKLNFVIVTYALNTAAFSSEIVRASISSVPKGQTEAAYSVGMTRLQTFTRIIAPQAVVIALPSLGTSMVSLLQDTSLAFSLGIIDVIGKIRTLGANTYHTIEGYVDAAIIFFILCIALEKTFAKLERKLQIKKS